MIASLLLGKQVIASGQPYDPSRIGSTIVQGIGFLAAGVIFTRGSQVKGLTTAAAVWVVAAIGLMIGAGFYLAAFVGLGGALFTLTVLKRVASRFMSVHQRNGNVKQTPPSDESTPQ